MNAVRPAGTTLLRAERAVDVTTTLHDAWICIDGDSIVAIGEGSGAPQADTVIDLGDATLAPGFIDLHSHGGGGGAYDNGADEILAALRMHRQHGTTRSVLSLVANPLTDLARSLTTIRDVMSDDQAVLGAHLEGPFLSPANHGAHEPRHLLHPTAEHVEEVLRIGTGVVRQITIAPELPGALEAIRRFADAGIVVGVGHTLADARITQAAFDAGATLLTHAFNAMPAVHHRAPGPIPTAVADTRIRMELILDAIHVHPSVARLLFAAAPDRVALITDAMAATGSPDGAYQLGSITADVVHGIARVRGTETIAGSTLTQDQALRRAIDDINLPVQAAIGALTATPAAVLGLQHRVGSLAPGFAADILALSPTLDVTHVWTAGTPVAATSRAGPKRSWPRAARTAASRSGVVFVGIRWGRLDRSNNPAAPSARNRRTHRWAHWRETPSSFATCATGRASSTTRATSSRRPCKVNRALAWDTEASWQWQN